LKWYQFSKRLRFLLEKWQFLGNNINVTPSPLPSPIEGGEEKRW
jgi:hypothetical protein